MQALVITLIAAGGLVASLVANRNKTLAALKIAGRRLWSMAPAFLTMVALVSLGLALVSRRTILEALGGDNLLEAAALAAGAGSVALMPGFVAFPLAGILADQGVAKTVLAAFTTTLMMVGVLTYPVERRYFGPTVPLVRNLLSLVVAAAVSLVIGLAFGEIL